MKDLPIGKQHLQIFVEDDLVYIDKTQLIHQMVKKTNYYFLSRPRRFGKSLLVDVIQNIFLGNQHLFEGLWIYDKIDWKKHPVIYLDFSVMSYHALGLETSLIKELKRIAVKYDVTLIEGDSKSLLRELIEKLSEINKVVFLVDEYDKPITDHINNLQQANAHRKVLREFYGGLKHLGSKIRLIFITGIAKFAKVSLFSVLNHLSDISMKPAYATLTGITEQEMKRYFGERIQRLANQFDCSVEELLVLVKKMYDGYSWDGKNFVYNPFSLLQFFDSGLLEGYWYSTGTPHFLVNMLRKQRLISVQLKKDEVFSDFFDSLDIRYGLNPYPLLFQTGYTTVKKIEWERGKLKYILDYPNQEVEQAFVQNLIQATTFKPPTIVTRALLHLEDAFFKKDIEEIETQFNVFFSDISYLFHPLEKKDPSKKRLEQEFKAWEGWFHTVVHLVLRFLGISIRCEVTKHAGRIDAVVEVTDFLYIIEFKLEDAEKGLAQIKEQKYAQSYRNTEKEIILMSIAFDQKKREVKKIKWEIWQRNT